MSLLLGYVLVLLRLCNNLLVYQSRLYMLFIMKIKILFFTLLSMVLSCNEAPDQRKINFPKTVDYVEKMPHRDSLWVFVMAGQSNMAGRGFVEPQDTIPNKRILTLDKSGKWIYAKEPLHFYEPSLTGLDCGLSFANTIIDAVPQGISIAIIPCAVGGSAIEQWLGDETYRGVRLLSNFRSKVDEIKKNGTLKAVLWHQGESNTTPELIPSYEDRLTELTATFRAIAANDSLPILIGQLGSYAEPRDARKRWAAINAKIKDYAAKDMNTYVIYTQDLTHKGDTIHFDSKSQRKMGKRFADRYLNIAMPEFTEAP